MLKKEDLRVLILSCVGSFIGVSLAILIINHRNIYEQRSLPPMSLQNVVCDTDFGVQYWEHRGNLTLRVNHEGNPIRCYE